MFKFFCLAMKYDFYLIKSLEAWLDMEERMAMVGSLGGRSGLDIRPGAVLETPTPSLAGKKEIEREGEREASRKRSSMRERSFMSRCNQQN